MILKGYYVKQGSGFTVHIPEVHVVVNHENLKQSLQQAKDEAETFVRIFRKYGAEFSGELHCKLPVGATIFVLTIEDRTTE